jgi:hypothetical protein
VGYRPCIYAINSRGSAAPIIFQFSQPPLEVPHKVFLIKSEIKFLIKKVKGELKIL